MHQIRRFVLGRLIIFLKVFFKTSKIYISRWNLWAESGVCLTIIRQDHDTCLVIGNDISLQSNNFLHIYYAKTIIWQRQSNN